MTAVAVVAVATTGGTAAPLASQLFQYTKQQLGAIRDPTHVQISQKAQVGTPAP